MDTFVRYYQAQGLFGMPRTGEIDYSAQPNWTSPASCPASPAPGRPQDRIALPALKAASPAFAGGAGEGGGGKPADQGRRRSPLADGTAPPMATC